MSDDWEAGETPRRIRRRHRVLLAAAAVAVAGIAVSLAPGDEPDDGSVEVEAGDPDEVDNLTVEPGTGEDPPDRVEPGTGEGPPDRVEPDPAEDDDAATERVTTIGRPVGGWSPLPEAPLPGRAEPGGAWTGAEFVVWGGRDPEAGTWHRDGAAYDPASEEWRSLPDAPDAAAPGGTVLWDDHDLVVLGADGGRTLRLDVDDEEWARLPAPPVDRWTATRAAAADGRTWVADTGGAVVELAGAHWDPLPDPPLEGVTALAAGPEGLVAFGRPSDGETLADDPGEGGAGADIGPRGMAGAAVAAVAWEGDGWDDPDPAPFSGQWTPDASMDDEGAITAAGAAQSRGAVHAAWRWHPSQGWTALPRLPGRTARAEPRVEPLPGGRALVWPADAPDAARVLVAAGVSPGSSSEQNAVWRELARPPDALSPGAASAWSGDGLFVWGEDGGAVWRERPPGAVALPPSDAPRWDGDWETLPALPDDRRDPTLAGLEDGLLAWSGRDADDQFERDGFVLRSFDGRWSEVASAPIAGRYEPATASTGRRVFVWGGARAVRTPQNERDDDAYADGAVYDAERDEWRRLPDAPLPPVARPSGMWDGDRFVVVSASGAAAYDPGQDAWQRLPDPPGHVEPAVVTAVDDELRLLASDWEDEIVAASLREGQWEVEAVADLPASPRAVSPEPTDDDPRRAGAWSAESAEVVLAESGWPVHAPPWDAPGGGPAALVDGRVVLWGGARIGDAHHGRAGAAAMDTEGEWSVLPDPPPYADGDRAVAVGGAFVLWSDAGDPAAFLPADTNSEAATPEATTPEATAPDS
ncbi:hypothetical protein ER308_20565 [Egibacter rhizosphaerae]|uniref:Galactose oxidase n=1 Tax=Egibacter rhizosphaerae TaxID=1670831 RepID=A0A411YKL7_9ACTN|nr:hypothetical protein [Egibacter rhizosphaerae]QBI21721.1 hypothetical protein ER308_20565 [Egibacter rhizosphaerae]